VLGGIAGLVGLSVAAGVLVTATVTPALAVTGAAATSAINMFDNLPSALTIDTLILPSTLYYKNPDNGQEEVLAKFYDQNRTPVGWGDVAPVMYDAILSSEDPRFYQHGGVDLVGTSRAILSNIKGQSDIQGGSSISQQYVKNVLVQQCYTKAENTTYKDDPAGTKNGQTAQQKKAAAIQQCYTDATTATGNAGIQRKLQEMRYAIALEQKYSKNDILLGYLNIANFGGVTYGIEAAANYYFGVHAKDLNYEQAATLAGMVQNPNAYRIDRDTTANNAANGFAVTKKRQTYVLSQMLKGGKITQAQYQQGLKDPIAPKITPPTSGCAASVAPYFCQYVVSVISTDPAFGATADDRTQLLKQGGLNIYTTLDPRMQQAAQATMSQYAPATMNSPSWKYGATITNIENSTGRVLSIAQNTSFTYDSSPPEGQTGVIYAGDNAHGGSSGFAPGSTWKLFTILDWLEKGHSLNESVNGTVRVIKKLDVCNGQWVNTSNTKVGNFSNEAGYVGTPLRFTAQSLNSGFFGMAEKLNLCDIAADATKLGMTNASDNSQITMPYQTSIIGNTMSVSPLMLGAAFAGVANNGVYCQPKVIDKVTDSTGADHAIPKTTCTQQVDPNIAATAVYALKGVMTGGGTGAQGNPGDRTEVFGKTGTNEENQTWLIQASTAVTSVVWSGVADGLTSPQADLWHNYYQGRQLQSLRYPMSKAIQRAADQFYPGGKFAAPDPNLTKQILANLPNVVGMSQDQATQTLQAAGFDVAVGPAVDSNVAAGTIAAQSPGPGQVAGGTTVTISPSNGQGIQVPDVSGKDPTSAIASLRGAGFGNVTAGQCAQSDSAPDQGKVTGTNPAAGSMANPNTAISVNYAAKNCPGRGNGGGNTGGPGGGNG
jgi:membrane peptidoglycan carboxypeptidase